MLGSRAHNSFFIEKEYQMQKNENAILRNSLQMMMNKLKNCKLIGSYVSLNDKDIQENIVDGNN
jgi:hypothetical protein